jgi:hypothetical protein
MIVTQTTASVVYKGEESTEFKTNNGIRQGDTLSATLFVLVVDHILRKIETEGTLRNRGIQVIAYADDIAIIAKQKTLMEETVKVLTAEARDVGLEINAEKTKIMTTKTRNVKQMTFNQVQFQYVTKFNYLGITVNNEGTNVDEIKEKIQATSRAYFANRKALKSKKIRTKTKIKIYKTIIRPIMTYAAETLTMTKMDEDKLERCERRIIRAITGPNRYEDGTLAIKTNKEIQELMEGRTITKQIKTSRLRWLGHIYRKQEHAVIRSIMEWKPAGRRPRGRPTNTWMKEVEKDIKEAKINNWRSKIKDRKTWKKITQDL